MRRLTSSSSASILLASVALAGCDLHDFNNEAGAINLAVSGDLIVVAAGTEGADVVDATTLDVRFHLDPDDVADSYDDVAIDTSGDAPVVLLFDADDGVLRSFLLGADGGLDEVSTVEVGAGPYSGVSASAGAAVVSGGTCGVTLLSVGGDGALEVVSTASIDRGQPDVAMLPDGSAALLSSHFSGSEDEFVDGQEFGLSLVRATDLSLADRLGLEGAGFTDGGGRPASWPVRASIVGDHAYVAHGGGLHIVRISSGPSLETAAHLPLDVAAIDVAVFGDRAYVVGVPAAVLVVDITDPEHPSVLESIALENSEVAPSSIVATADRIVVARAGLTSLER